MYGLYITPLIQQKYVTEQQNNDNNRATPPDYKTEPVYSMRFPMVESRGAFVRSRPEIAEYSVEE
jgi:hypothetical protein